MRRVALVAAVAGATLLVAVVLSVAATLLVDRYATHVESVRPSAVEPPRVDEPGAVGSRAPRVVRRPTVLRVPRLDLTARVTWDVDRGPAWWKRTGRPGGGDVVALAGHRTTHTRPFYYLERLRRGDRVVVEWRGRRYAYRVSGSRVFPATDMHIGDARGHEVLLLSACTPRGSARQRLVVYAWPA